MKWVPVSKAVANDAEEVAKPSPVDEWSHKVKDDGPCYEYEYDHPKNGKSEGKGRSGKGASKGQEPKHGQNGDVARTQNKGSSKGDRGSGKGGKSGKANGKGKDGTKAGGVKTMQEVEAEMKGQAPGGRGGPPTVRRPRGPEALAKQPIDTQGKHCEVRKHSGMGCAVVSMESYDCREAVMVHLERKFGGTQDDPPKMDIQGNSCEVRRHTDRATQREVITDLFLAWGHKQEKENPLSAEVIAEAIDRHMVEAQQAPPPPTRPAVPAAQPQQFQPQPALAAAPPMIPAGARSVAVPPPPMHTPSVAAHPGAPMVQPQAQAYYDYQRAAYGGQCMPMQPQHQQQHMYYQQQQQQQQQPQTQHQYQQYYPQAAAYQQLHQHQQQQQQHQQAQQMRMMQTQMGMQHQQGMQNQQVQQGTQSQQGMQHQQVSQPMTPHQQPVTPHGTAPMSAASQSPQLMPSSPGHYGIAPLTPLTGPESGMLPDSMVPLDNVSPERKTDYQPAKPRIVPIVDPKTGQNVDTLGLNFKLPTGRKPLQIVDPRTKAPIELA